MLSQRKTTFFYKEHEPYGLQQEGVHSMLVHICKVWPSLQSFHYGRVHFVGYPLLVDETSPTTAKNSGLRPKVKTKHLSFGTI